MNKKKGKEAFPEDRGFGTLLKWFRTTHRNLSQQGLARKIGVHSNTVCNWETHVNLPGTRETVLAVARTLSLDDADTDRLLFAAQYPLLGEHERSEPKQSRKTAERQAERRDVPVAFSPTWKVPHSRNPYFTGREALLEHLHKTLSYKKTVAVTHSQAISGLGGIGKTQAALEYAYRYHQDYKAVFWVRADTRETLFADFVDIAEYLNLPQKEEQEQARIVQAVKQWFHKHAEWLLILDNADDLATTQDFMPTLGKGHILLTTRAHSVGHLAPHPIELDVLEPEEGLLFLLRRAGILSVYDALDTATEADRTIAGKLVQEMEGLPLALDQAGAYIEETECGPSQYLDLYLTRHADLLKWQSSLPSAYPYNVATTWSLSFQQVEERNPIAVEMLRLCAFLHPDAIPEDVFIDGGDDLGPILGSLVDDQLRMDEAIDALLRYSLIKRNPETRTLTIHRLVQVVLKDTMDEGQRRQWAERTVRVIDYVFPEANPFHTDIALWPDYEKYLSHAHVCLTLIEQYELMFPEAARLLYHAGCYKKDRWFTESEPFLKSALTIREKTLGPKHLDVAISLQSLGILYTDWGKFAEAESTLYRALVIYEELLGLEHSTVAIIFNDLGLLYWEQYKYLEAEAFMQRSLAIKEKILGSEHSSVATSLSNLGYLYVRQGKYAEAEPVLQRALTIREKTFGTENYIVAISFNHLGDCYTRQGKYDLAEPILQHALAIREKTYGPENRDVAASLKNLGYLYVRQGKYAEAEPILQRAYAKLEKALGSEHLDVANCLNDLVELYFHQGKYIEAKLLYQRALAVQEKVLGTEHPETIATREQYIALQKQMQNEDTPSQEL